MADAALLAIGSELLGTDRLDTNSLTIAGRLASLGVKVVEKRVLADDAEAVAEALRSLLGKVGAVIVTGGLGPTFDDVTRQAAALALGVELHQDEAVEGWIRDRFRQLGRTMPEVCLRMAQVLPGARMLRNPRGSAPGMLVEARGTLLALLPGVSWEMELMLERDLVPEMQRLGQGRQRLCRTLLLAGVVESETEQRLQQVYQRFGTEDLNILASYGVLRLRLVAEDEPGAASQRLDELEAAIREILGHDVAAVDTEQLAPVVLELLEARGETLALAESCTGGLVSSWITEVPGSSAVFLGGAVSYSNGAKESLLGVPTSILEEHGAVSEPAARAMARGARERLGADWALAITGIAGPAGGTTEKPVGLVYWAVAGPNGDDVRHRVFAGNRAIIRQWSANSALDLLRRTVLELGEH